MGHTHETAKLTFQNRAFNVGPNGMGFSTSSPSATSGGGQSNSPVCVEPFPIVVSIVFYCFIAFVCLCWSSTLHACFCPCPCIIHCLVSFILYRQSVAPIISGFASGRCRAPHSCAPSSASRKFVKIAPFLIVQSNPIATSSPRNLNHGDHG